MACELLEKGLHFSLFQGVQAQIFFDMSEVMAGKVSEKSLTFDPYGVKKPSPKCQFENG